jgi:G3E family GTPase
LNDARIPVVLLTGFLGSGKTSLLNAWLRGEGLRNAAVIVNEFGEVGIDHTLIASSHDNTIELSTGCLCCTVRGDLVDTLRELTLKRASGQVPSFDRLIIETTGLADPGPVLQALMTSPVAGRYRLQQVITTVDAVNGASTLEQHALSRKQVAVADEILLTKIDLTAGIPNALLARLRELNPGAPLRISSLNAIPEPDALTRADVYDPSTKSADAVQWLNAAAYGDDRGGRGGLVHDHHDVNRHGEISSFCLEYTQPLTWHHVAHWLDALVIAHGDDLLRVKGILDIAGSSRPIVVQAVQHLFHRPFMLAEWTGDRRKSQLVFITRGLTRELVSEVFNTIRAH